MPEGEFGGKYRVLAALIRERRRELNLSQRQAVVELKRAYSGFDRSIWRRWEKGDAAPSWFWLPHVAAVLQLPVSTLREARTLPQHRPAARPAEALTDSASYVERHDPPSSLRPLQTARSESPEILHTQVPEAAQTVTSEADAHFPGDAACGLDWTAVDGDGQPLADLQSRCTADTSELGSRRTGMAPMDHHRIRGADDRADE